MTSRFFKNAILPVLAVAVAGFVSISALSAKAAGPAPGPGGRPEILTKFDVEQVVHNYIATNPKLILDSIDNYQKKNGMGPAAAGAGAGGRGKAIAPDAMEKNRDALLKDPASPFVGNPNGNVTVVEFMDYNCHFCKDALVTILSLIEKDKNVRVVLKDFPILGPPSELAAKWALASQRQNKYFAFHSGLMKNKAPLNEEVLANLAKDAGLNVEQMKTDVAGPEVQLQLEKNRALGSAIGVTGTPAFIIGDELIPGALPVDQLLQKIESYRKKPK